MGAVTVTAIDTSERVRRRLAEMGIRRGARIRVLRRTSGGGLVLAVNGSRIAVDSELAAAIEVDRDV